MPQLSPVQRGSIGVVILAGAIGAVVYVVAVRRGPPPRPPRPAPNEAHGKELDTELSPLLAMAESPEASTPCETSFNSITAGQKQAKVAGIVLFDYVAPREEFLAKCQAMPEKVQWCLTPRYSAAHRDECLSLKPPDAVLDSLRKLHPQDAPPPPISTAPPVSSQ